MIEFILGILKGLLGKLVTDEFVAGCPSLAAWLVTKSAGLLIEDRDRYLEEWLAVLADRKTALRKLLFAVGILWAACRLRRSSHRSGKSDREPEQAISMQSRVDQLYSIRAALLRSGPTRDTVTGIAARYGVTDFSLFTRNYKALFGEAPARTLYAGGLLRERSLRMVRERNKRIDPG